MDPLTAARTTEVFTVPEPPTRAVKELCVTAASNTCFNNQASGGGRGERGMQGVEHGPQGIPAKTGARWIVLGRDALKDVIAGLVASVVLIGNIVSFGALMFPGDLHAGIPVAIWAMLIGGCVGGVWIALATSLPPLASGIDSPTGAVLVLLSAMTASAVRAAGGGPEMAVQSVMLVFTAATFLSGVVLYGLGACRWGSYFRFVPYPVVGGFLAATGYFLIAGAVRMTPARRPSHSRDLQAGPRPTPQGSPVPFSCSG